MAEQLIKSHERVKKFAEVYTPKAIVDKMLDLVDKNNDDDMFVPEKTYMEPACGNGNFLIEILRRKLERCNDKNDYITALTSIYGVDIQADNIEECKQRLLKAVDKKVPKRMARKILDSNIVVGNFLDGDRLFLYEWRWQDNQLQRKKYCFGDLARKWEDVK